MLALVSSHLVFFLCRVLVCLELCFFGRADDGQEGGKGYGSRGALGAKIQMLQSKNVSCGSRASQRGPDRLWGLGHQWSEKPSISVSLRAAGSKVVQCYLFMRCIYG